MRPTVAFALVLAGAPLLAAAPARAGGFQVLPVQVTLSRTTSNALIAVQNDAEEEARYQLELFAWRQDREGQMQLEPSKDLIFFPLLLTLKPGEQRHLRVGAGPGLFGPVEKTYRLFVQELPPAQKSTATVGIRVLTRVGIPIFLEPGANAAAQPEVQGLSMGEGKLSFTLRNTGTAHVRPLAIHAQARSGTGELVGDREFPAWYVLAGGERIYEAPLPRDGCARVRSISVEVSLERNSLQASLPTPGGACPP